MKSVKLQNVLNARYTAARADLAAWAPKLRPGGLLAGHDYSARAQGVARAVHEACAEGDLRRLPLHLAPDHTYWWVLED